MLKRLVAPGVDGGSLLMDVCINQEGPRERGEEAPLYIGVGTYLLMQHLTSHTATSNS